MAVAGVLVVAVEDSLEKVLGGLHALPGVSVYGHEHGFQVAAVLEAPSAQLSHRLEEIQALPGVLNAYVTYVNIEDELGPLPGQDGGHA